MHRCTPEKSSRRGLPGDLLSQPMSAFQRTADAISTSAEILLVTSLVLPLPRSSAAMRLLAWRRDRRWVRRLRSGFLLQHFTPLRSKRNRPIRWRQRSPSPTMTRHCVRRTHHHQHHTAPLQQSNPLQPVSRAGEVIELACRLLRREMSQVAKRRSAALSASPPLPGARRTFKGALASSDSLLANHASWTFVPANDS